MASLPTLAIGTALLASLSFAPPDEVITPTQPQPGEPAIAPAVIDNERAMPEPMPVEPTQPQPVVTPEQPAPEPDALPSWQADPQPGQPQPGQPQPGPSAYDQPAPWTAPVIPTPPPPPRPPVSGAALFGPAAGLFVLVLGRQGITSALCDDLYCGNRGIFDHVMMGAVIGLAGGGGWLEGKRVAWKRDQAGQPSVNPLGRRIGGWMLFSVGVAGLITDFGLYNACYGSAAGPYTKIDRFVYTCSPGVSAAVTDLSGLVGATGAGLALSAESQLRHQGKFELSVQPRGGHGQFGLSLSGRF